MPHCAATALQIGPMAGWKSRPVVALTQPPAARDEPRPHPRTLEGPKAAEANRKSGQEGPTFVS